MTTHEVPIGEKQFSSLKKGDKIVDMYKREWDVIKKIGGPFPTIIAQCPGHDPEPLMFHRQAGIVDEEWGTIIELNPGKL